MTATTLSSHGEPAPSTPLWHALQAGEVLDQLTCNPATGLSAAEVTQRRAREGSNALPEPPRRSMLAVFARQFKSPLIYILFAAAVLAVAMAHHGDAVVMSGLVMIGLVMRPQGRVLRFASWVSVGLLATGLLNAVLVFLHGGI